MLWMRLVATRNDHHDHEHYRTDRRQQAECQPSAAGELDQLYEERAGVRKRDVRLSHGELHASELSRHQ
jgi:hypothetical protein